MSHFSVVLPSDSSMDVFPDNTVAHYTTKLSHPICCDGDYEVALVELIYPLNYDNFITKEPLGVFYPLTYEEIRRLRKIYGITQDNRLNFEHRIFWKLSSGYFKNEMALVNHINTELMKEYRKIYIGEIEEPLLSYDERTKLMTFRLYGNTSVEGQNCELKTIHLDAASAGLSVEFIQRFGLDDEETPFELGGQRLMYVYSDIVTPYLVGDVQAPLLRTIAPKGERGELISTTFANPYYVPVARRGFDTIQIHINNELGEPMPFTGGKSVAVLHFKRCNESLLSYSTI